MVKADFNHKVHKVHQGKFHNDIEVFVFFVFFVVNRNSEILFLPILGSVLTAVGS
jgi:hypothetical protein